MRAKVALIAAAEHGDAEVDGGDETGGSDEGEQARARLGAARRLWSLSERLCWRARAPVALVICGPAASGKSTLAAELARRSEMTVLCSDVVRKRLAHLDEHEPARPEHYSARFTRATYERLGREALLALRQKDAVIVDATCRSREDRALLLSRLQGPGMALLIVRCEVPLKVALERAARRMDDPSRVSDATPPIAEQQFRAFEELDELSDGVLGLDTTQPLDTQVSEIARAVDRAGTRPPV